MLKPKDGPGVFDYLDARYGVPKGESDSHYVVVAKSNRSIYVKRGPINSELLDTAKGSSGHRKSKEHAVHILTAHRIPSSVLNDWGGAIEKVEAEEDLPSDLEAEGEPIKHAKGKSRVTTTCCGRSRALSLSVEAESESDSSGSDNDRQDPITGHPGPCCSSRLRGEVKSEVIDLNADNVPQDRSTSVHSEHLFHDHSMDSEVEEIHPGFDNTNVTSRKRSTSTSLEGLLGPKRHRSTSYNGSAYSLDPEDWKIEDEDEESLFLKPVTSSFSAPLHSTSTSTGVSTTSQPRPSSVSAELSLSKAAGLDWTNTKKRPEMPAPRKGLRIPGTTSNLWCP
ncbi:hypothetical protein DFH07DRAFT_953329 [Mycena maculata]|uniref:Uncharacterized protein n=1 Tax=Mycena maculata TaxID=230809 RepID=A0AAD7NRT5_9AGAR|nr:hypothetical protein DFH07DRAFT_953329 [Mycena maculata]